MPMHIELIARAIVIDRGRILACQRKGTTYWALPGGHIEWGESAEAALRRELREECGVKSIDSKLWFIHENRFGGGKGATHEIVFAFHVKLRNSAFLKSPQSPEKKLTLEWLPIVDCVTGACDLRPIQLIAKIANDVKFAQKSPGILTTL